MHPNKPFEEILEDKRLATIKSVLRVICHKMVYPLYFAFWIADIIYVPEYKWPFLLMRLTSIPLCMLCMYLVKKAITVVDAEKIILLFTVGLSCPIAIMSLMSGGAESHYYAGLNMVAIGTLSFIPSSIKYWLMGLCAIYLPYFVGSAMLSPDLQGWLALIVNSFFIVGTVVICFVIRHFYKKSNYAEAKYEYQLHQELKNREEIILQKTKEGVKLQALSNQFSPQVVHAIKTGEISLKSGVHDARVCALFIDIVNSTERVTSIHKNDVDRIISMFMEDTIKILLKYDITVDKFMGDGILAFCNDPIRYSDYIQRVVRACSEIVVKIRDRAVDYETYWDGKFEVTIGIAAGEANVGFYGSEQYFRSYTAIGPVINLASRLCGKAEPNQILISKEVADSIKDEFQVEFLGEKNLKGFDGDELKVYELCDQGVEDCEVHECPECDTVLHLGTDTEGIFVFSCRSCGYIKDDPNSSSPLVA